MARDIKHPKISFGEGPRRIIAEDFPSVGELPIRGGWGYSRDDAVIIDKNDPLVPKGVPFFGLDIENVFVEKRIYEELIVFQPKEARYSGIRWNRTKQALIQGEDGKSYDLLHVTVTALPSAEWEALKAIWEGPDGAGSMNFDKDSHWRKHEESTIRYDAEYWFEISSFC